MAKKRTSPEKPPAEELLRRQTLLIEAAQKGKEEFSRVWDEIFHPDQSPPKPHK